MTAGDRHGRHRVDARGDGARPADDAGARPLLRRPRALEEHAQHVHDVHRGARASRSITWVVIGYSLAFDGDGSIIGGLGHAFLQDVTLEPRDGQTIPHLLFMAFQATFCIVTTALVSGAVVERMRFGPFLVFAALWSVLVYAVLAHWAFGGGWLMEGGTLDFAGGVPVEMASGLLGARGGARRRRAQGLRAPGAPAAQRGLRPARRRPAVVRLVRLQRRQRPDGERRQRARVRQHADHAGVRAGDVVRARPAARAQGHRDRRGDGDHRRLRRHHAGGRLHQPRLGDGARRRRGAPELRDHHVASAHARGRDARRARRARHRRG